jgi:hypothetical protein
VAKKQRVRAQVAVDVKDVIDVEDDDDDEVFVSASERLARNSL